MNALIDVSADERAHRIADAVAESAITDTAECIDTGVYRLWRHNVDDFVFDCIHHLKYNGQAAIVSSPEDEFIEIVIGDFSLSSLAVND